MKIAVITRCLNEQHLHEFVRHYSQEGVDHIYIIDDNSKPETYGGVEELECVTVVRDISFKNGNYFKSIWQPCR